MNNTFEIEIQRNNVTPSQFLAYVRSRVDSKGGKYIRSDLDIGYFRRGDDLNFDTYHDDDDELRGIHEKSVSKPYEMQTFISYPNGDKYNEICEFAFDDEKTGHGYYYLLNVNTPRQAPENATEAANDTETETEHAETETPAESAKKAPETPDAGIPGKEGKKMVLTHAYKIGGAWAFTLEGALHLYKLFAERCFADFSVEASCALANEGEKLHALGVSWETLEEIEIEAIKEEAKK